MFGTGHTISSVVAQLRYPQQGVKTGEHMKKKAELTPDQIDWLRQAHNDRMRPEAMAEHLGYHVDTIKRLLDRYGIRVALSSKHITTDERKDDWTRPCMKCKDETPRPRNQYICTPCKRRSRYKGVDESYLVYC